jgi:hypothetical protein
VAESQELIKFARGELGAILRELRQGGGLATSFANKPPLSMRDSMVRMIETGHADLPIKKASAYAGALNARSRGDWSLDADALQLAYTSLRSVKTGNRTQQRFNWNALFEQPKHVARSFLREQLTRRVHSSAKGSNQNFLLHDFDFLNPIQRQMLHDIARRVEVLGSDIVTEGALAAWETANVGQIVAVKAAVASLGSELEEEFIRSISMLSQDDAFGEWRYLIATDDRAAFEKAVHAFKTAIEGSQSSRTTQKLVRAKFNPRRISQAQFKDVQQAISQNDAYYLYEVKSGSNLLVGVFRRCPPLGIDLRPVTLESWGCIAVNEVLRWNSVSEYAKIHDALWAKAQPNS